MGGLDKPIYRRSNPGTAEAFVFSTPRGVVPSPKTSCDEPPGRVTVVVDKRVGVPVGAAASFAAVPHRLKVWVPAPMLMPTVTRVIASGAWNGLSEDGTSTSSNNVTPRNPVAGPDKVELL